MPTIKDVTRKVEEREEIAALEAAVAQAAAEDAIENMLDAADGLAAYVNPLHDIIGELITPIRTIMMLQATNTDVSKETAEKITDAIDDLDERYGWLFNAMSRAGVVAKDEDDEGEDEGVTGTPCTCPGCAAETSNGKPVTPHDLIVGALRGLAAGDGIVLVR